MNEKTRILICDDHTLYREGIKVVLREQEWLEVVDEAVNGREAVLKALQWAPDIILMDISMPDLDGIEAAGRILRSNPKIKVLFLTMYEEEETITSCLRGGAAGYLLKDAPIPDLVRALEIVRDDGQYLSSRALTKVVNEHVKGAKPVATGYERLSDREKEVLQLLADGMALKDIATRLSLSVKTVDAHKTNMMRKLNLHDRSEVIKYAIQQKLIPLNDSAPA